MISGKKRLIPVFIAILLILSLLAACGETKTTTQTQTSTVTSATTSISTTTQTTTTKTTTTQPDPVRIGVLEDTTGAVAAYGAPYLAGQKVAVQIINDGGGIKSLGGAKIELVQGIGDSTVATATSEVERLINSEKVVAISGPTTSGETMACIPLYERYKIPAVTILTDITQFQKGYRYIFTDQPTSLSTGTRCGDFVDWLIKKYATSTSKMAVCTAAPSFSGISDAMVARLNELGYKNSIVLNESFPLTVADQAPLVLKLKAANVDFAIYMGSTQDAILFYKACDAYSYTPWLVASNAALAFATRDSLGALAKTALGRPNVFAVSYNMPTDAYQKVASLKTFADAFQKANPGSKYDVAQVAVGAQKMFMLAKAIENAASRNPENIAAALRKLDMQAPDPYIVWADGYPRLQTSESGALATQACLAVQYSDDLQSLQVIWPESIATATPRTSK